MANRDSGTRETYEHIRRKRSNELLDALKGRPKDGDELARELNISEEACREILNELMAAEKIVYSKHYYALNGARPLWLEDDELYLQEETPDDD